jgi:lysophospholipase L1-like esterase
VTAAKRCAILRGLAVVLSAAVCAASSVAQPQEASQITILTAPTNAWRIALALGFGGDRTENALWRLQQGEIDGIATKVAVLMAGTNNSGHRGEAPEFTAPGIKRLLDEMAQRLPNTRVLLLAVFPSGEKPDGGLRRLNDGLNKLITGFADGRRVHFLDVNAALPDADGRLGKDVMPDLLNPNEKGYEIWQRAMAPTLRLLLKDGPLRP